jgi:hypothetical protein
MERKTAVFSDPLHGQIWQSQTQDIVVADNRLIIRNDLSISTAPGGNGR